MSTTHSNQPNFHDPNLFNWCVSNNDNAVQKHYSLPTDDSDVASVGGASRDNYVADASARSAVDSVASYVHDEPYLPPPLSPAPGPSRTLQYSIAPDPSSQIEYSSYSSYETDYTDAAGAPTPRLRPTSYTSRPDADSESPPEQDLPYLPPGYQPRPLYLTHPYQFRPHIRVDQNPYNAPPLLPPIPPIRDMTDSPSLSTSSYETQPTPPPTLPIQRRSRNRPLPPPTAAAPASSPGSHQRSRTWLETDRYLRTQIGISQGTRVDLWALPDPPPSQKPQQPLPILVKLAIHGSERGKLTLQEIYQALEDRFEWFHRRSNQAWKNSIRHNLSLNQVFRSSERPITEPGKGRYWELDISKGEGYKRERRRNKKNAAPYNSKRDLPGGVGNIPMNLDLSDDDTDLSEENTPPAEAMANIALSVDQPPTRVGGRPIRNKSLGMDRPAPYPDVSTAGSNFNSRPSGVRVAQSTTGTGMGSMALSPVTPTVVPANISQYARETAPSRMGFAPSARETFPRFGQPSLTVPGFGMGGMQQYSMAYSVGAQTSRGGVAEQGALAYYGAEISTSASSVPSTTSALSSAMQYHPQMQQTRHSSGSSSSSSSSPRSNV